jgi:hypothetical protein
MGQFFLFVNRSKGNAQSTAGVRVNFGLSWAYKMEKHPEDNREIFLQVIRDNKWDIDDDVGYRKPL